MNIGLYIHIPFCRQKCLYCDFPSYAGYETLYEEYIAALCREVADRGGMFSHVAVDTIYLGGGTPTLLPEYLLAKLLEYVFKYWQVARDAEISMEANPGTVTAEKLKFLHQHGVNRISFGVQSFHDRLLSGIGRIHCSWEAVAAIKFAEQAGFSNINIDLMYGLPEQSISDWQETLVMAARLGVQHISVYGLKIEEDTPFYRLEKRGELRLPDEDQEGDMYQFATEFLPRQGFKRYEISNYAVPGYECRHNIKYWRYQPYLGLGAAAHSFIDGRRSANNADVRGYISSVNDDKCPVAYHETPNQEEAMAEYIFLALRTTQGLSFIEFKQKFGVEFTKRFAVKISDLTANGLLKQNSCGVALTEKGMQFGNIAFQAFLP